MNQKMAIQVEMGTDKSTIKVLHPGGSNPLHIASVIIDVGLKILQQSIGYTGESPIEEGEIDQNS